MQSLLLKSSSNFIWMLLCLPFSAQLCAHAHGSLRVLMFPSCVPPPNNISFKATAKTFQPLPSHYVLCSPPPDHQNLPITRQRSTIKTYVYTTVSFMDQRVEKGGGGSRNRSTVSTVSSSKLPWSASSRVFLFFWSWILCTVRSGWKLQTMLLFNFFFSLHSTK